MSTKEEKCGRCGSKDIKTFPNRKECQVCGSYAPKPQENK